MPDDVIGLPDMLKTLGTVIATLVTVPLVAGAVDTQLVPLLVSRLPDVLGATNVGADAPLPRITLLAVRVVRLVPPLATGSVPVTPVVSGKPVRFVAVPLVGVPKIGVTRVGLVANTAEPVPVSSVRAPAKLAELNEPSSVALPVEIIAPVKLALVVTLPAVNPAAVPVMFVPIRADGVPRSGVTKVGEVLNTKLVEVVPVAPDAV